MPRRKKAEFECPPDGNYAVGGVPVDKIEIRRGETAIIAAWPQTLERVFDALPIEGQYQGLGFPWLCLNCIDWKLKAIIAVVGKDVTLDPQDVYWVRVVGRGTYVVPQCRVKGRTVKVYGIYFYEG